MTVGTDDLPPLDIESSIKLIEDVLAVHLLREMGIVSWWLFGTCVVHGDFVALYVTEGPMPEMASLGLVVCLACERAGNWPRQFPMTRLARSSLP